MLTIYATVDKEDGLDKCLWVAHRPHLELGRVWMGYRDRLPLACSSEISRGGDTILRALFPRGMKPGELRKFKIPRLGEKP